jgi:hypothetical protein
MLFYGKAFMKIYGLILILLCAGVSYAMEEKAKEKPSFLQKVARIITRRASVASSSGSISRGTTTSTVSSITRVSTGSMSPRSSSGGGSPRVWINEGANETYVITSHPNERENMTSPRHKKKVAHADSLLEIAGVVQLPVSQAYYIGADAQDDASGNNSGDKKDEAIDALTALKTKPKHDGNDDGGEYFD